MSVFDPILKNQEEYEKFKTYAESATTEARRIELCQKYLEAKNALPVKMAQLLPMPMETQFIYPNADMVTMSSATPAWKLNGVRDKAEIRAALHKELIHGLAHEINRRGYIQFKEDYRGYEDDFIFTAKIKVYKEQGNGK